MTDTFTVSNRDEFYEALEQCVGGETILLEGGNYGQLTLGTAYSSNVTIASVNISTPATFTGLGTINTKNVVLDGLIFDYTFQENDVWYIKPFEVKDAENITIKNSIFDGDRAWGISEEQDGFGYGFGLSVRGSRNVILEGNEFYEFRAGMVLSEGQDYRVTGNDIHTIRTDGMNVVAVQGITIEDNHFHDFQISKALDHRDMIQFWTNGAETPTTDVVIRKNVLDVGNGPWTQAIFMRNEAVDTGQAGYEMYYRNLVIEDNLIINNHLHGITVGEADGLRISNNTLLHSGSAEPLTGTLGTPRVNIATASKDVTVVYNAVSEITGYGTQGDWTIADNVYIQHSDPKADNFYGDLFVTSSLYALEGPREVLVLAGTVLDQTKAGAAMTHGGNADGLYARIHVTNTPDNPALKIFDAGYSSADGASLPQGTYYEWHFGDGTIARGPKVSHTFDAGGSYGVRLVVVTPDNAVDSILIGADVANPKVLMFDGSLFTAFEHGDVIEIPQGSSIGSEGLKLGGAESEYSVSIEHVRDIFQTDEFGIDFGLKSDTVSSSGEVFRIHASIDVSVTEDGEVSVQFVQTNGARTRLTSSAADVSDLWEHEVSIRYQSGHVSLMVDGTLEAEAVLSAPIATTNYHGLSFGSVYTSSHFSGAITSFSIHRDSSDFPASPETTILTPGPWDLSGDDTFALGDSNDVFGSGSGNDQVFGGGGNDELNGMTGDDSLIGGSGDDLLKGSGGRDFLDGGSGNNTMEGGLGNDRYVVNGAGDIIQGELGYSLGGGIDRVESYSDYTMAENLEILRLKGSAAINGTGSDTPESLIGNAGANVMAGNGGNDSINAKAGNDTLDGGTGADTLVGGAGADTFVYDSISDSYPGQGNRDFINDFLHGAEKIDLSTIDANPLIPGDQAFVFIGASPFPGGGADGAGKLRYANWGGNNYNIVEADWNGDGTADFQLFINQTHFMTGTDFIL